ncbi:MAG: CinA family protein, partial [Bacillota bacterium]
FERGFVTYSNEAKVAQLGVDPDILEEYGAVSAECVLAMAQGARRIAGSELAVAVSGIAGPGGGSDTKPVGLVFVALASVDGLQVVRLQLSGARKRIKELSSKHALFMLYCFLTGRKLVSAGNMTVVQ